MLSGKQWGWRVCWRDLNSMTADGELQEDFEGVHINGTHSLKGSVS